MYMQQLLNVDVVVHWPVSISVVRCRSRNEWRTCNTWC